VEEAGFPPGAFNFVYGPPDVAEHLCRHPGVDFVTFTGSAAVGRRIVELTAPTLKRVVLELGGKSADVVLPGSNVQALAASCVSGWAGNAGQGCSSLTRTLVHQSDYDAYLESAVGVAEAMGCGDPHDPATMVGPLISASHRSSVAGYVERAVEAGGRILTGGRAPARPPRLSNRRRSDQSRGPLPRRRLWAGGNPSGRATWSRPREPLAR
jgi:aldehyde dehydrogenase (NAD+)